MLNLNHPPPSVRITCPAANEYDAMTACGSMKGTQHENVIIMKHVFAVIMKWKNMDMALSLYVSHPHIPSRTEKTIQGEDGHENEF